MTPREEDQPSLLDDFTRRLTPGGEFILDAPAGVPAVWGADQEVLWARDEPMMLVGPQGAGKTTLAQQLVLARLGLRPAVLGMPVEPETRRVLYLACDRPAQVQRSFARMVTEADRETLDKRLVVWKGPPPCDLARQPGTLTEMCQAADAGTVVLDSLKDVAMELSKDDSGAGLNQALQRAIVGGTQVVSLHHQRKNGSDGAKPKALADVYGSVWVTAGHGSVVLLWGQPGDAVVELSHLKQPAEVVGPFQVVHDHITGSSMVPDRLDEYEAIRAQGGQTAREVAMLVHRTLDPRDNLVEQCRRKLKRHVSQGRMVPKAGTDAAGRPAEQYYLTPAGL